MKTRILPVFLIIFLSSCMFFIDDYSELLEGQETAVHSVLDISETGEVVAEGEVVSVSGLGSDCADSKFRCYFSMKVEGVIIFIHYLSDYDPDRTECLNSAASEQALKVRNGDHVKLFGKYLSAGSISTCGDLDYYIEILPSQEPTHTINPVPTETFEICSSTSTTSNYENGITWTEVLIPDKRYEWSKSDLAFLKSCLQFPEADDHDKEIHGERIQNALSSDLRIFIGEDFYETKSDDTGGCCDYELIKNGTVILQTSAPLITTEPNRGFWNVDGTLVWELLKQPPTIIVNGVDYNEKYDLDGSFYPYEIKGELLYIAQKDQKYQVVFDNEYIGPEFSEISMAYCCSGMSIIRGGGKYLFLGKHDGAMYIVLIQ